MKYQKTPFDGKEAIIIGDHPHVGEKSICIGANKTFTGSLGLVFENKNTNESFYVFDPKNIKWV